MDVTIRINGVGEILSDCLKIRFHRIKQITKHTAIHTAEKLHHPCMYTYASEEITSSGLHIPMHIHVCVCMHYTQIHQAYTYLHIYMCVCIHYIQIHQYTTEKHHPCMHTYTSEPVTSSGIHIPTYTFKEIYTHWRSLVVHVCIGMYDMQLNNINQIHMYAWLCDFLRYACDCDHVIILFLYMNVCSGQDWEMQPFGWCCSMFDSHLDPLSKDRLNHYASDKSGLI